MGRYDSDTNELYYFVLHYSFDISPIGEICLQGFISSGSVVVHSPTFGV
jgi:hypothetical protein